MKDHAILKDFFAHYWLKNQRIEEGFILHVIDKYVCNLKNEMTRSIVLLTPKTKLWFIFVDES